MSQVSFRRVRGRIVPFTRNATGTVAVAKIAGASAINKTIKKPSHVKPNKPLQALAFGSAVASGVLSGATFFSSGKGMLGGFAGSLGLDALSTSSNVISHAGSGGSLKSKAKSIAKTEAVNTVVGNSVMIGTMFALPSSRRKIIVGAANMMKWGSKVLLRR